MIDALHRMGIMHMAKFMDEPRTEAEWQAWGYHLHGPALAISNQLKSDDSDAVRPMARLVTVPTVKLPWPLPTHAQTGDQSVTIAAAFQFECNTRCNMAACSSSISKSVFSRYSARLKKDIDMDNVPGVTQLKALSVCIESASAELGQATNESYSLRVYANATSSSLSAQTVFGAMRGMETLVQLTSLTSPGLIESCPVIIDDSPAFGYRGLMINPAKTFMPIEFIMRIVDGLVLNKLNVLHVHWTDVSSFPIESLLFPQLSRLGRLGRLVSGGAAARPNATVYTQREVRNLIFYARLRGVRVIAEFDLPGHGGWSYGMPELTLEACPSVLDVTSNRTYAFLEAFLGEMADLFQDEVLMLGGDEVGTSCHNATNGKMEMTQVFDIDPNSGPWLRARNLTGANATQYFWQRVADEIFPKLNKSGLMVWYCPTCHTGDPPLTTMPASTIANVWGSIEYAAVALNAGYHAVLTMNEASAFGSGWYLPYGATNGAGNGCQWPGAYTRDPLAELKALGCDQAALQRVDGGSAAAWSGEHSSFDDFVWQGTMAVAERLWSGGVDVSPQRTNATLAEPRFAAHICRMKAEGFAVRPYKGESQVGSAYGWCTGNEAATPSGDYIGLPCYQCPAEWLNTDDGEMYGDPVGGVWPPADVTRTVV